MRVSPMGSGGEGLRSVIYYSSVAKTLQIFLAEKMAWLN